MNACAEPATEHTAGTNHPREKIPENVAEDHARLLAMIRQCLAEIGIVASLTTFHGLFLHPDTYQSPTRYEPELDVFRPDEERPGIALRVKLTTRDDQTFYSWGVSWACSHPASDPVGAVKVIAEAALAA